MYTTLGERFKASLSCYLPIYVVGSEEILRALPVHLLRRRRNAYALSTPLLFYPTAEPRDRYGSFKPKAPSPLQRSAISVEQNVSDSAGDRDDLELSGTSHSLPCKMKYDSLTPRLPANQKQAHAFQRTCRKVAYTFATGTPDYPEAVSSSRGGFSHRQRNIEDDVGLSVKAANEVSVLRKALDRRRERIRELRNRLSRLELAECRSANIQRRALEQNDRLDKALERLRRLGGSSLQCDKIDASSDIVTTGTRSSKRDRDESPGLLLPLSHHLSRHALAGCPNYTVCENMTVILDRKTLKNIARKTLGRGENDERPISTIYIAHLKHFLAAYPDEQDFTIDLDSGYGSVYCRVCQGRLPPGDGDPEEDGKDIFGAMSNFEWHVKTTAHRSRKAAASTSVEPPRPVANVHRQTNATPGPSSAPSSCLFIDLTEDSPEPIRSGGPSRPRTPDVDEDYLLALKLDEELNGPRIESNIPEQPNGAPLFGHMVVDEILGSSAVSRPNNGHRDTSVHTTALHEPEDVQDEIPFEETYHAHILGLLRSSGDSPTSYKLYKEDPSTIQIRCLTCHFSVALPASGSVETAFNDIMECFAAYGDHLKTPHHTRKRHEAAAQAAVQDLNSYPISQYSHSQSSSMLSDSSTLGKRKLPGSWNEADEAVTGGYSPSSNSFDHAQHAFVSAMQQALDHLPQESSSNMDYHSNSQVPVVPNNNHPGFPGLAERSIAIRRFQELQAATMDDYGSYRGRMNSEDFNINYDDGESSARIDYGGGDVDKQFREFMNQALEEFKDVATVAESQNKLNMRTENDLLNGMVVRLLPHQIIGVAWMVDQEKNEDKLGGILADAMGLGKTIQMIATMVFNRPPSRTVEYDFFERHLDKGKAKEVQQERKTTLVLAPASLLQQWYEEFDDKVAPGVFRVHIHHGKDKLKTVKEIEEYDVIIASHQSVVMDFPKEKKDLTKQDDDEEDSSEQDTPVANRKTLGPLARVQWLRVVIDEAQNIRNKSTRTSTCVAKLDSRYRWCLTGTPITNTLADIYAFMRFCRFAPWNDWKLFNEKIARVQKRNPNRAGQKAQAVLRPHLLRRTKDSKLDGRPIIRLGPKTIDMIELEFTPEERLIYEGLESRQKKIVSRFVKEGTVMKNYSFILVMILRLRQLCCHPRLATTEAESEEMDADKLKIEFAKATKIMGAQKVKEVTERFKSRILHRMKAELGLAKPEDDECAVCMEPIVENRRVTSCAHEFCSVCINEVVQNSRGRDVEDSALCPLCRAKIDESHVFVGKIFEPSAEQLDELEKSLPKPASGSEPSSAKRLKVDGSVEDTVSGKDSIKPLNDKVEPSTKMQCMLEGILKWRAECPGDKAIVYSQWTSMLDLVEAYLKESGVQVLRYDGRMNRLARVDSVARFKKPNGPPIMLVSLKCGGVGLNLTVANRVINLDLAWNYATEAQAYDRVHRLGQQKPVEVQRLIIRGTIEERIIRLQAKKQGLSDAALGEGTGNKLQRLTARDIAQIVDGTFLERLEFF
ncbi:hypothetical protein ACEPAI_2374 [Sanghuangporus weigelae]